MKPLTSRGSRPCWLYVFSLLLAVLGGFSPQSAQAQVYPKEYIRVQPLSAIVQEGGSIGLDVEYAFGQDSTDQTPVYWYRNGVLVGTSIPVLQTYVTPAGVSPKLYDPYAKGGVGEVYDNATDAATASSSARARWLAVFSIPAVSANEAGMYYAKVADVNTFYNWTYTNFVQVAMVPTDTSKSMEIVRSPLSKSLSAPNSDPVPSIKLYGDMRSHISPLLHTPFGTTADAEGFTYVADTLNHCIRKVSPGGHVTTLAGMDGQPYRYTEPSQYDPLKRDARTRKERDPVPGFRAGVTNQAQRPGDPTAYRFLSTYDAFNQNEPLFKGPEGITISDLGVVYVADTGNNAIRGIRTDGNVTTVFDLYGNPGSSDLKSPRGVFFSGSSSDPVNNPPVLFVLDSANYSIKKLYLNEIDGTLDASKGDPDPFNPTQRTGCEKIAGLGQTPGWQGVPVSAADAKFYSPRGIAYTTDPATGSEIIYIADTVNHVIRQLTKVNNAWTARTVVGFVGAKGNVNAVGTAARLNYPVGLALDEVNQFLYFTEFGNHSLRRVNLPYNSRNLPYFTVDLVAGSGFYGPTRFGPNGPQGTGNGDGLGALAVFYYPAGIAFNKTDGSILLTDTNNNCLRKVMIATTGTNAWIGDSATFAGTVGVAGNRDFSDLPEYTYHWKKDALLMTDNAPAAVSSTSGSLTDTLAITNVQYEDAGVYALVVTNAFEDVVETVQSFVYIATAGDQPKFLSPGYRIESSAAPGIPLVDLQQGLDILILADILPSDQVTYQWEVTEDLPDVNGDYDWIPLSDLPIAIQTLNNPKDVDTVRNAQRIRLGTLLGTNTTTISGATAPRLAVAKLQASLTANVPPKLRFRVLASTKAVPTLPLDTKVETTTLGATWTVSPAQTVTANDATGLVAGMTLSGTGITPGTKIKSINGLVLTLDTPTTLNGNTALIATLGATQINFSGIWTAVPEQTVTVDTADGLSVGMYLVGTGIAPDSKIKAIDTSNPLAILLTLDTPVLAPGTNVQISGAVDLVAGTGLSIRYPVIVTNPSLSVQLNAMPVRQLANSETVGVVTAGSFTLSLTAGTSAALGNPTPAYQWYKRDSVSGTPGALVGETQTSFRVPSVQTADRGYYFVTISNGVGASVDSNTVFVDVARPPSLAILSMTLDGGTLTSNVGTKQERRVDKRTSAALSLTANVDASAQPTYVWEFKPDDPTSTATLADLGVSVQDDQRTYGQLSFATYPDDGDGVFTLTITVPASANAPAAIRTCSWHVTVKYLPQFVPGSKVFQVGTLNVTQDFFTVDLNEAQSLHLSANFKSPRSLPPLTYRWRRDKVILASTTNTLDLDRIIKTDIGTYKLEVTNALGTLVFGPTTGAEIPFPGTPAPAGWKLTASGKPSVVIQPNGKPLVSTNSNISAALAGTVASAPRASSLRAAGPAVQRVALGQRVALQVAVDADPAPTYQWYKARYEDVLFSAILGAKSAIYVLPTATDPVGTRWKYYVIAKNSLGEVKSEEIVVQTEGLPDPVVSATAIASPPWTGAPAPFPNGSVVILSAAVTDSQAAYTYQWKVNGNPVFGAVSKELTLSNIEAGQAGSYSVVATGVAGSKESAKYTVAVTAASAVAKHSVFIDGADELKTLWVSPTLTDAGLAAGTKVTLTGVAPSTKMLQSWRVSYVDGDGNTVTATLPARSAQFVMPAADVTATPVLSRPYTGSYTGLLSLEAPWFTADGLEWATEAEVFRPTGIEPGLGNIRGLFTCTVSTLGAVSGQILLENKTYSFTTVLDAEMRGSFRIATTLKGVAWSMNGTLAFNPTEENRQQGFVDNVVHVVIKDALLATPPLVQVGQTLYAAAAGFSGASEALRADVTEGLFASSFAAAVPSVAAGAAAAPAAPGFTSQPVDGSVPLGGTKIFFVVASGTPPFTYQWLKAGNAISGATTQFLTISNVKSSDFGSYTVRVTNAGGSTTSSPAVLSLLDTTGTGGTGVSAALAPPMNFTAAVYREANGETKTNSFGQAAVLSAQVRSATGATVVQGYLANGTKVTFSTYLGRSFITPQMEGPDVLEINPNVPAAIPFVPTAALLSGQAAEAVSEALLRKSSSQSIPLWFRGDSSTEPVFGTMIFNGPRVYGSLGALNLNTSTKLSEYTPNALAGYFYDPTEPHMASVPANQFVANQTTVTMTTPDAYLNGLSVSWPSSTFTPPSNTVLATVDGTTGLLFGGILESTSRYVQILPTPYSPVFAAYKSLLACTTAGVVIQKADILPGFPWTPNTLGGYVGFLYRGKNAPLEPYKNVLGNGTPETAILGGKVTGRVEPFLINITDQY